MSGPAARNPLNICGAVVSTYIVNALKRLKKSTLAAKIAPSEKERNPIQRQTELQQYEMSTAKEKNTRTPQGILWEDVLL
jgi:hypothetical protein